MQVVYFTVDTVNYMYVQIMRCSCDWTTHCFNAVSKHVNANFCIYCLNQSTDYGKLPPGSTVGAGTVNIRFLRLLTVRAHSQYNHRSKLAEHNPTIPYLTLPYLRGGCLQSRHPALRPQHGPNAQPRQTSRSIKPLESFDKLQEKK